MCAKYSWSEAAVPMRRHRIFSKLDFASSIFSFRFTLRRCVGVVISTVKYICRLHVVDTLYGCMVFRSRHAMAMCRNRKLFTVCLFGLKEKWQRSVAYAVGITHQGEQGSELSEFPAGPNECGGRYGKLGPTIETLR